MGIWYRVLVVAAVAAAMFCMTAVICFGFSLWQAGKDQELLCDGDVFRWSNGIYVASGELANGVLERMVIEKALPPSADMP